jgi:hypothetical protein
MEGGPMNSSTARIAVTALIVTVFVSAVVQIALPATGGGSLAAQGTAVDMPLRTPPPDAVILFDGKNLEHWRYLDGRPAAWKVQDGIMTAGGGNIISDETFADAYIHVEFQVPYMPDASGQGRGNSGVYVHGRYEIQVLDSYGIKTPGQGDCGAVYGQYAPLVNACKPPLTWQSYDIVFRSPRVDSDGKVLERPRVTVFQNDQVIQNDVEVLGTTTAAMATDMVASGPLMLQDHGNPVQYHNVWLVHLPLKGSDSYEPK